MNNFIYQIVAIPKVIDGDTFDADLDLGFYTAVRVRIRLTEIDTYELYGPNAHALGEQAKDFTDQWLVEALRRGLWVQTFKPDPSVPVGDGSFGRWLGDPFDEQGQHLIFALQEAGFVEYES